MYMFRYTVTCSKYLKKLLSNKTVMEIVIVFYCYIINEFSPSIDHIN